jgi:hypothetical protein
MTANLLTSWFKEAFADGSSSTEAFVVSFILQLVHALMHDTVVVCFFFQLFVLLNYLLILLLVGPRTGNFYMSFLSPYEILIQFW